MTTRQSRPPTTRTNDASVTRFRARFSRHLFAVLLLLGFGFFNVESLIADECDGDANQITVTVIDDGAQGGEGGSSQPRSGHAMHVCHCMHAHGGIPVRSEEAPATPEIQASVAEFSAPALADPALELELRPPIA
jgi:hypothetical protein